MLLAMAWLVITTIQRTFLYFFVFFFPKVPRPIDEFARKRLEKCDVTRSPALPEFFGSEYWLLSLSLDRKSQLF